MFYTTFLAFCDTCCLFSLHPSTFLWFLYSCRARNYLQTKILAGLCFFLFARSTDHSHQAQIQQRVTLAWISCIFLNASVPSFVHLGTITRNRRVLLYVLTYRGRTSLLTLRIVSLTGSVMACNLLERSYYKSIKHLTD